MNEIKCPNCGKVFQIDESSYESIVKQIRDHEFEKEITTREKQFEQAKENAVKIAEAKTKEKLIEEIKGKNKLLGYIARCLLSDKTNDPVGLGLVASFFQSMSGKPMNLSVQDCPFKDFEKDENGLHPDFVKAVKLLRKCGFKKFLIL